MDYKTLPKPEGWPEQGTRIIYGWAVHIRPNEIDVPVDLIPTLIEDGTLPKEAQSDELAGQPAVESDDSSGPGETDLPEPQPGGEG